MSHRQKISVARKLLRHIFTRFQPSIPFAADQEKKGIWAAVAKAQPHTWQKHQVTLSSELQIATPVRMLVLSDLHVGSHSNDLQRLSQIVAEVAQRQFDLLLLPGDFVNMQVFGGGRVRPYRVLPRVAPCGAFGSQSRVLCHGGGARLYAAGGGWSGGPRTSNRRCNVWRERGGPQGRTAFTFSRSGR